ncbi:MAG TPA: hypothetical protein VN578_02520 [Candidatus Binatia bacterium]|jgi:hypothetical protein|nr:hypothetical protein [Candidatus Binatia bacterium]
MKIDPSYQIGLRWKNDQGEDCVTLQGYLRNGKREATLVEADYIGSIGAMHYYAKIRAWSPNWSVNGDKGGHGGYGGKSMPKLEPISIEAKRVLKVREFDANGKLIGKVGDETYRFNSPKAARAAALRAFRKHFAPGWVLVSNYSGRVVAETGSPSVPSVTSC